MGVAPFAVAQPVVKGGTVELAPNGVERIILKSQAAPLKTFTLQNPDRAVIDLPGGIINPIALPPEYKGSLLKAIRYGRFNPTTSRVVFDLAQPAKFGRITSGDGEVIVELLPLNAAVPADEASSDDEAPQAVAPSNDRPLIVIDAGHGGQDSGALSHDEGMKEKDITLRYARSLADALLRSGRYRVALTRDSDRFIMLPDRVTSARKLEGDLFISLHADSNPNKEARGFSVYTLSETASDDEAAALAERENKSDVLPGMNLNTADEDVASILIDLTQRETMGKSTHLADAMVEALHPKVTRLPRTHRYAGFRVLKAPDIPSVLIELGFLSNPKDAKLLQSREYQSLVVSSIVKGIDRYLAEQKR
jgi:N-acetylmuramoyl-L-alanine amidase